MGQDIKKAAFSLNGYRFNKVSLDLAGLKQDSVFDLDFKPSGLFHQNTGAFRLTFLFSAKIANVEVISVNCQAEFMFESARTLEDIPDYFYANSIAILFPYVRAFVSTVSLQANIPPIIIPTLNLSPLKDYLKANTIISNGK